MKILFASHIPNQHIKDKDPLGIMCLSATLKQANHEVRICSPEVRETGKMLEEFPADVIAYSIATGDHSFYIDFNRVIKNRHKNIYSVFGGPHCTFNPDFITENLDVDAMATGEVDLTFVDFINSLESDGDYHLTPNFHVRRDGEIYRNEVSNHIPDLDDLPFPDRSVIYDYYPKAAVGKVKSVMSMRGCPYPCTYCHNHQLNELYKGKGKILRRRSVDNVIKEILDGDISIGLVTLIIRRISLQSLKIGFDPQYHIIGDFDVVVRIALKGGQVACEQGPVGYYRWHGSNESIKNKRLQLKETESWLSDMGKTIDNHLLVKFRQKLSYNKAQFYLEDKRYLSFFLSLKGVGFSKELLKVLFLLFLLFFPRTSQKIRKI